MQHIFFIIARTRYFQVVTSMEKKAHKVIRAGSEITYRSCFPDRTIFERSLFRKNIEIARYYSAFAKQ